MSVDACKPELVSAVLAKVIAGVYRKDRSVVALVYTAWQKKIIVNVVFCFLTPPVLCCVSMLRAT